MRLCLVCVLFVYLTLHVCVVCVSVCVFKGLCMRLCVPFIPPCPWAIRNPLAYNCILRAAEVCCGEPRGERIASGLKPSHVTRDMTRLLTFVMSRRKRWRRRLVN